MTAQTLSVSLNNICQQQRLAQCFDGILPWKRECKNSINTCTKNQYALMQIAHCRFDAGENVIVTHPESEQKRNESVIRNWGKTKFLGRIFISQSIEMVVWVSDAVPCHLVHFLSIEYLDIAHHTKDHNNKAKMHTFQWIVSCSLFASKGKK